MMTSAQNRQVIPVSDSFFNDGAWSVLSSTSLGGSGLSADEIVTKLQSEDEKDIEKLLQKGICLPLFFPGDCALDNVVIVIGDLTDQEEREWIGRIQSKLEIPCGEFLLLGGGGVEDDWEDAIAHFTAPDPDFMYFQKFKLDPGSYLVEVYAFLGSMTVNFALDEVKKKDWAKWFQLTDLDKAEYPDWFKFLQENEYIASEEFGLQEYLIRLSPLQKAPDIPETDEEVKWCCQFEIRPPASCPQGVLRSDLLS
jgi:hypothetical protein